MWDFVYNLFSNLAAEIVLLLAVAVVSALGVRYRARIGTILRGTHTGSPDGKAAVYESQGELYLTDRNGLRNISHHPATDTGPVWSLDGHRIAFMSNRGDSWDVFVYSILDRRLVRITDFPGTERPVGWNATGDLMIDLGGSAWWIKAGEIDKKLAGAG